MKTKKVKANARGETRSEVLRAAGEVFAEKGYRDATIAEICRRAGANIAAVNYYFGSKEGLYAEAWRAAFEAGLAKHPPDGGVAPGAAPEDRLRARMTALLRRVLDPDTREFDIMRREMSDPTGLLQEAQRNLIGSIRKGTFAILREMLGPKASLGQVVLATMTVMSPVLHAVHRIRHARALRDADLDGDDLFPIRDIQPLIDHTMRFCLAGIRRMREGIEAGDWPDMELPADFVAGHKELLGA